MKIRIIALFLTAGYLSLSCTSNSVTASNTADRSARVVIQVPPPAQVTNCMYDTRVYADGEFVDFIPMFALGKSDTIYVSPGAALVAWHYPKYCAATNRAEIHEDTTAIDGMTWKLSK